MSKPYQQLRDRMSPESRARAQTQAKQLRVDMALNELRHARSLTQERLAGILKVNQAAISKLEGRTDMYISTLRSYIESMGGDLDIVARFPEGDVHIQQFHEQEESGAGAS